MYIYTYNCVHMYMYMYVNKNRWSTRCQRRIPCALSIAGALSWLGLFIHMPWSAGQDHDHF